VLPHPLWESHRVADHTHEDPARPIAELLQDPSPSHVLLMPVIAAARRLHGMKITPMTPSFLEIRTRDYAP